MISLMGLRRAAVRRSSWGRRGRKFEDMRGPEGVLWLLKGDM